MTSVQVDKLQPRNKRTWRLHGILLGYCLALRCKPHAGSTWTSAPESEALARSVLSALSEVFGRQYRSLLFSRMPIKTRPLALYALTAEKNTTLPHDPRGFAEHDCWASHLPLSMIKHKLRPAHRPGQTRLCLPPPLALVPGKLVRKLNGKLVQILLVQCYSLCYSKMSTACSTETCL